jgi:adenylate cyclase
MVRTNTKHESNKTNPNSHDDEGGRYSSVDISSSYRRQTILNLHKSGITTDVISSQTGISQEKVDKIIQDAYLIEERQKGEFVKQSLHSSSSKSSSSSPNPQVVDLDSLMRKSQTRVWKTLEGEPEFVISVAETQNMLKKFARYKTTFVILNVDLVGSTSLSMTLPLDRLTMIIQSFNQEMSVVVKEFGGYVLKYVGDAVLAFFVVPGDKSEAKVACINAVNCAKYMLRIAREAINPILNQYDYPEINLRIGVDIGENAIIQSGWDIHPNIRNRRKNNKDVIITNHNKKQQHLLMKKPVYDVLSYTLSIAVKMTALASHNHLVIGDPVYKRLDHKQRSGFQRLHISPDIWDYVCKNSEGDMYNLYTDV